jgi:hypothetical protein
MRSSQGSNEQAGDQPEHEVHDHADANPLPIQWAGNGYASPSRNVPNASAKGRPDRLPSRMPRVLQPMVGILNSAPARIPVGQREVTAFCLV